MSFPPLRLISRGLIGLTNVLLPGKGLKEGPFVSEQELLGIVEAAAEDEVIEHEERELIESIIEFGDTVAREVMVPRPDMVIVENDSTVTAALDLAIAHGFSRLPVHADDGDDIIGLIYMKDLIRAERDGQGDSPALDLARPVRFIPENKPVARLMREMQAGKFHLAIVADEYGRIAGLITLEDCLEELVGEIVDEYDIEELAVQRLPNGDYLVDGGVQVEELNELLDIHIPDEEWDTVGGFLFGTLEHVPEHGEAVEYDGWRFAAEEVEGRRIRVVRVSALRPREHGTDGSRGRRRGAGRPSPVLTAPVAMFAGHGDLARRQGRPRHRGVEGNRQGDRRRHGGVGCPGDAEQPQAGPARGGGGGDEGGDGRVRRQRRRPRRRRGMRRGDDRDASAGSTSSSTTPAPTPTTAPRSEWIRRATTRRSTSTCAGRCSGPSRRGSARSRTTPA